ncbi:MAG: S8 family serine peptidase [Pseudomonadota bacterium]
MQWSFTCQGPVERGESFHTKVDAECFALALVRFEAAYRVAKGAARLGALPWRLQASYGPETKSVVLSPSDASASSLQIAIRQEGQTPYGSVDDARAADLVLDALLDALDTRPPGLEEKARNYARQHRPLSPPQGPDAFPAELQAQIRLLSRLNFFLWSEIDAGVLPSSILRAEAAQSASRFLQTVLSEQPTQAGLGDAIVSDVSLGTDLLCLWHRDAVAQCHRAFSARLFVRERDRLRREALGREDLLLREAMDREDRLRREALGREVFYLEDRVELARMGFFHYAREALGEHRRRLPARFDPSTADDLNASLRDASLSAPKGALAAALTRTLRKHSPLSRGTRQRLTQLLVRDQLIDVERWPQTFPPFDLALMERLAKCTLDDLLWDELNRRGTYLGLPVVGRLDPRLFELLPRCRAPERYSVIVSSEGELSFPFLISSELVKGFSFGVLSREQILLLLGVEAVRYIQRDDAELAPSGAEAGGELEPGGGTPAEALGRPSTVGRTCVEHGDQCLIAIVDEWFDPFHMAFQRADSGESSIEVMWIPRTDAAQGWLRNESMLSQVHFLRRDAITELLEARIWPQGLPPPEPGAMHGAMVAAVAAGAALGAGDDDAFTGGAAPAARLLLVDTAGSPVEKSRRERQVGYEKERHLQFCKRMANEARQPVVFVIAAGCHEGAHDGTTFLERAIDDITSGGTRRGVAVVVSAGNEGGKGHHARVICGPACPRGVLAWQMQAPVEVEGGDGWERVVGWFPREAELEFRLTAPGKPNGPIGVAGVGSYLAPGDGVEEGWRMTFEPRCDHPTLGRITVAMSAREERNCGLWRLEVRARGGRPVRVDFWIQIPSRASVRFLDPGHPWEGGACTDGTLTIPATAKSVIAVGGVDTMAVPARPWPDSSRGPCRDGWEQPKVSAAACCVETIKPGSERTAWCRSGTSLAAPRVAGAIACVFSAAHKRGENGPPGSEIAEVLKQTASRPAGWDEGLGAGIFDEERFLAHYGISSAPPRRKSLLPTAREATAPR